MLRALHKAFYLTAEKQALLNSGMNFCRVLRLARLSTKIHPLNQ
jgi:hypothetical protein